MLLAILVTYVIGVIMFAELTDDLAFGAMWPLGVPVLACLMAWWVARGCGRVAKRMFVAARDGGGGAK